MQKSKNLREIIGITKSMQATLAIELYLNDITMVNTLYARKE